MWFWWVEYNVDPKGRSCEPSVSWFAVYRMCNETVTRQRDQNNPFFQMFLKGFGVLTTNASTLDPVVE